MTMINITGHVTNAFALHGHINQVNYKGYSLYWLGFGNVAVGHINMMAALMGFSYK